ncbi:uncharacterized protein LOC142189547 [Leptodactylus fuscus]|uniref:uncharacterized protein LOC142189547 n=1 Tax=Leptodactylus fuscus TaxID=238119 RepID=UPI003F4F0FE6
MDKDGNEISRRLLDFTLEIIYLLTGEDYKIVKKTSGDGGISKIHNYESDGGWSQSPRPSPHPPIQEEINGQKILELINKMLELLTGEVPIRCQDVAVYFSMEEWEYLEGHKDLYKEVMMEDHQPLTSAGRSSKRTTPERCPSPLLPQDDQLQDKDLDNVLTITIKDEPYVSGDEECEEDIPTGDRPDDCTGISEGHLISTNYTAEDNGLTQDPYEEHVITPDIPSSQSSDSSQTGKQNESQKRRKHQRAHIGEKSFSCSECMKSFSRQSNLVRHLRSHTGEEPYSCSQCGKCYSAKSNLASHQKIHKGQSVLSCSQCGKGFIHQLDLVKQQRIHTGEKPYSCPECEEYQGTTSDDEVHVPLPVLPKRHPLNSQIPVITHRPVNTTPASIVQPKAPKSANPKKKGSKQTVWLYFTKDKNDPTRVICKTCEQSLSRGKDIRHLNTNAMPRHLKSVHPSLFKIFKQQESEERDVPVNVDPPRALASSSTSFSIAGVTYTPTSCAPGSSAGQQSNNWHKRITGTTGQRATSEFPMSIAPTCSSLSGSTIQPTLQQVMERKKTYPATHEHAKLLTYSISKLLALEMVPFRFVESKAFRSLMAHAVPQYVVPNRHYFSRKAVPDLQEHVKQQIKRALKQSVSGCVHLTTDTWTSQHGQGHYLSLTAHWVNIFDPCQNVDGSLSSVLPTPRRVVKSLGVPTSPSTNSETSFPESSGDRMTSTPEPPPNHGAGNAPHLYRRASGRRQQAVLKLISLGELSHTAKNIKDAILAETELWFGPVEFHIAYVAEVCRTEASNNRSFNDERDPTCKYSPKEEDDEDDFDHEIDVTEEESFQQSTGIVRGWGDAEETIVRLDELDSDESPPDKCVKNILADPEYWVATLLDPRFRDKVSRFMSITPQAYRDIDMYHQRLLDNLMDTFSTENTSVFSERLFSTAGGVVTELRTGLSADNVDRLSFIKMNEAWIEKGYNAPLADTAL